MKDKNKFKILFFDIESLPCQGFIWNTRDPVGQHMIKRDEAILTIAYKWNYGEQGVLVAKKPYEDRDILKKFSAIYEQADYVVGHYSDKFDIKYIAYRMLVNNLNPLPTVKSIDTYKMAKKHFKFVSNKLDYIGRQLGVGRKNPMGWADWEACAEGNKEAIKKMAEYNLQDVLLLESVFNKMLPHCPSTMINHNLLKEDDGHHCPGCGSCNVHKRGVYHNKTTTLQRYKCTDCGQWSSSKKERELETNTTELSR